MVDLQRIELERPLRWVLPCPRGTEEVLSNEVRSLGLGEATVRPTAVQISATLRQGYRLCLWSRIASRVLLPLVRWSGDTDEELYDALRSIAWWEHFEVGATFAIGHSQAAGMATPSHYWVQRSKDAIADAFRERFSKRPNVDKKEPDIRFHLHVGHHEQELALDFSGTLRRGYRTSTGIAPIKENLAAAILALAGWPEQVEREGTLLDPTCGSGTFLIEAAMMATRTAPGLLRSGFGFERWLQHDEVAFEAERRAAIETRRAKTNASIIGYDASSAALDLARANLEGSGLESVVTLARRRISEIGRPADRGTLVCNPPYGHRLGDEATLFLFYQALGDTLKRSFAGWDAFVFAAQSDNLKHIGLRPTRRHVLYNGGIECRLLEFPIREVKNDASVRPAWRKPSRDAEMFRNRIRKNRKKWERWARRERVDCYRLYDSDIPEYPVAVDRYGPRVLVHVYSRSAGDRAQQTRIQDVLLTLPSELGVAPDDLVIKSRHKQDQGDQYPRLADEGEEFLVNEGALRFIVNLRDRIDTGLFLDHRKVRSYATKRCAGKRVLNLFAYTCSVSVAAARGGAQETTNVDLSSNYLDWGRRNFRRNDIQLDAHRFIRGDVSPWIARHRDVYDWIFINPPTFSRSKQSKGDFSIHQHHPLLIERAMSRLTPDGELLFTTHARDFRLDRSIRRRYRVEDSTKRFVPPDFARSAFRAFRIGHTT